MADSVGDSASEIGKSIDDFSKSTAQGKTAASRVSGAVARFSSTASSIGGAFYNSSDKFSKFEESILSTTRYINYSAAKIPGLGGTVVTAVNGLRMLTDMVFKQNDAQLTAFDRASQFGVSVGTTTEQLSTITHQAGAWINNNEAFLKSIEETNTGLISLGKTTSEGVRKLADITNTNDVMDEFMRLGQTQDHLRMLQTKYIKMQETLGFGLDNKTKVTRQSSLDYASSLVGLSTITGHSVDELAEKMAAQANDLKFNLKLRELQRSGDEVAIKNFKEASTISATMMSPQTAAGVRDFLSNGVATTKEGEALMMVTRGEVGEWADQLQKGQISGLEFNKRIAQAKIDYEKTNRKSLQLSKTFQEQSGITGEEMGNLSKIMSAQNAEDVKSQIENAKKQKDSDGKIRSDLKETQIAEFKTAQKVATERERMVGVVSGPVNHVFRMLADLVKQTAVGSMKLGNWLTGGTNKELQAALDVLGDDDDMKKVNASIKRTLADTDKQIAKQIGEGIKTKAAQAAYDKALQDQKAAKTPEDKNKADTAVLDAKKALDAQRKREKNKYGSDSIELEKRKQDLLDRQAKSEKREKSKNTAKIRQGGGDKGSGKVDETRGNFLEFRAGSSNDAAHFEHLDPAFASTISDLAERYSSLTGGKKLTVNSSFRSKEEQDAIYKAWVAAGGSKNKPFAGGYYMPSASGSAHSSGRAIDIDASQLEFLESKGVLEEFGLYRPHKDKDPVHLVPKASMGGMFKGPDSGYAALLHGTEAKIPLSNGKISIDMNNRSLSNYNDGRDILDAASSSSGSSAPAQAAGSTKARPDNDFTDILLAKLDDLNGEIEESNRIYSDIKLYAMN